MGCFPSTVLMSKWADPAHSATLLLWSCSRAACWCWMQEERQAAARKALVPGCEGQCRHLLANTLHVHLQLQLVVSDRVGTQGDLVEEKRSAASICSLPKSHHPCVVSSSSSSMVQKGRILPEFFSWSISRAQFWEVTKAFWQDRICSRD